MDKYMSMTEVREEYNEIPADERTDFRGYLEQLSENGLLGFEPDLETLEIGE